MKHAFWVVSLCLASAGLTGPAFAWDADTSGQADTYCVHNAHALLMNTANLRDPRTEYCYGIMSHSRNDEVAAVGHFRKSAEAGYAPAQVILGAYYAAGVGVAPDPAEGQKWFKAAADQGAPEAQYAYGGTLMSGRGGLPVDAQTGVAWIRKASDAHYALAQYALASAYKEGKGVPQDYAEALRLYRLSAAQGYPEGLFATGVMTFNGWGTPADKAAGVALVEKAARRGVVDAQLNLANVYAVGDGAARDDVTALTWYEVAAMRQGRRSLDADTVEKRMTPDEVRKAKADAKVIAGPGLGKR